MDAFVRKVWFSLSMVEEDIKEECHFGGKVEWIQTLLIGGKINNTPHSTIHFIIQLSKICRQININIRNTTKLLAKRNKIFFSFFIEMKIRA
jgi:hypothetical protein